MSTSNRNNKGLFRTLDWYVVIIYLLLLAMGWMSVCGASYDFDQTGMFFDLSSRSGMQLVWIGSSLLLAGIILAIDDRVLESFSNIIYIFFLVLLAITPLLAHDIKGSMSWIKIGSMSIQPAEFAKFGTALCVAKVMSAHDFSLSRWRDLFLGVSLIILPMLLIILQKETGSALVYLSFFLMLYREGMSGSFLFVGVSAIVYFIVGVKYMDEFLWGLEEINLGRFLTLLLIYIFTTGMMKVYGQRFLSVRYILWGGLLLIASSLVIARYVYPFDIIWVQLALCLGLVIYLLYLGFRNQKSRYLYIALFALGSLCFHYSVNYVMENVLQPHQQMRIRVLLGTEDDPRGAGYNVIQAKIAIGSGGLKGKGFLNGTQTKLKYVPEQDTDFIFCTVGEEEGFVGCAIVLLLFLALLLRIIWLSERQPFAFGRIFGYCVMSIFLFHLFINVGMVLGLTPVIGIPLPFFSYGGSSLWGFTILLFVFLRIDAGQKQRER